MDAADSDHSITWEDFFGSTTDLTPTLIGIYDSLFDPANPNKESKSTRKSDKPDQVRQQTGTLHNRLKAKELESGKDANERSKTKMENAKIPGGIKLPVQGAPKSSLYSRRTDVEVQNPDGASVKEVSVNKDTSFLYKMQGKKSEGVFDNLSPNVKRMISSADTTTTNTLKQKKSTVRASVRGPKSNIPLVGATSKISQSGVDILDSVEIYDQPTHIKKNHSVEQESPVKLPPKIRINEQLKPKFRLEPATYDVPINQQAIYDVPHTKTAFESLSLPYIDQSIELSPSNEREFDTKLKSSPVVEKHLKVEPINVDKSAINVQNAVTDKDTRSVPSVEVTRPLSMSSIASSSSTSSSGVQNKGVNSAYLASIESLDDHSDADMVSGKGSNNFVNSTGMLNTEGSENRGGGEERCVLSQLERVCSEIVETENVYVEDLRQVVEGYLHVWRENRTLPTQDLDDLFNNIEDIYAFNRSLCDRLNTCQLDPISLARQFGDDTSGFEIYTSYCTGYPQTMSRLASLASCPSAARECRERQAVLHHALPLGSYLLKPVQRILKYHLLLKNLVKHCPSAETEYALLKMTEIAQHIDEMKRKHEHAVRVQEIQSLLYGWSGPDLTTFGELCAEGTFRVFGAKAMRHAFLFDKMLLFTKNREDGILAYKSHIMCNNLMLVESIAGAPLSFHVIPWDNPRSQLTLQACSQRNKREWTLQIKRVILENYNAVIPSHARQLVMELGQNKTDDDMLAEKSRNLITHTSMRKQLSAPEYLEKRKLERERRKTCENRLKPIGQTAVEAPCDCAEVSSEKGTDFTCDRCYNDLCTDCEAEMKDRDCTCKDPEKCPECDRSLHYIDAGSAEHLERRQSCCKCPDFQSSQESFEYTGTLSGRGYHSSDNIVSCGEKSKESDKPLQKTCLKCAKIKENIAITDTLQRRKSRRNKADKKADTLRSKSKEDPQRSKLSKISTWRRKSEPGLENGVNIMSIIAKKANENEKSVDACRGNEKIEFECRNCGSNRVTSKLKSKNDRGTDSDQGSTKSKTTAESKNTVEVRMYNTKHVPKKISKLRKNRAKGLRLGADVTAKFYADFSTDVSTENILHISESTDSINTIPKESAEQIKTKEELKHDMDIDEETYKKLLEKTDSFKKSELEKVKYLNEQKVINEGAESETDKQSEPEKRHKEIESGEESEKPLEQIISQLLMQNREFQKILKKQQQRNSANRRHQRLLKSHSNPEDAMAAKSKEHSKIRPKYGRQTSENLKLNSMEEDTPKLSPHKENQRTSEDEHIYETLRMEPKNVSTESNKSTKLNPSELLSPPIHKKYTKINTVESDYVYLSFDQINKSPNDDEIYDVPSSIPVKNTATKTDYYVAVNKKSNDNVYDCVDSRAKNNNTNSTGQYLPMSKDQANPNTPEIWLSRQKEHFNMPRDRKSGSLPRSFQIVTPSHEDTELSTFKGKLISSNKTYLNKDGKVLSMDRPFTIASDKSEIRYDDVEAYMSENDVLKYRSKPTTQEEEVSRSTLDLEEEIDRCYKTNFEKTLDDSNRSFLNESQQNINNSVNSSCEVLSTEKLTLDNMNQMHPEHKIYRTTANFSIKNVLGRLKNKSPNKNTTQQDNDKEINLNNKVFPDNGKADLKSPTSNEKRSALNPRSYSKNLLQRFKNIIADEHPDDNRVKIAPQIMTKMHDQQTNENNTLSTDIKVVNSLTNSVSPTLKQVYTSSENSLSKSFCGDTDENEKSKIDPLFHSCENIKQIDITRPLYEKSTSVASTASATSSPSRRKSDQNMKLPIYKQGSKLLGARIAQSDYVDPQTLSIGDSKTDESNVNVLINRNSMRPDSLLSNSSFITSSSDSTCQMEQKTTIHSISDYKWPPNKNSSKDKPLQNVRPDQSFYEKSFEKIERIVDEEIFRDSAVYSDQDDSDGKIFMSNIKSTPKHDVRAKSITHNNFYKNEYFTDKRKSDHTSKHMNTNYNDNLEQTSEDTKQKNAPPVPAKPKIIPTANKSTLYSKTYNHDTINQNDTTNIQRTNVIKTFSSPNYKINTRPAESFSRSESLKSDTESVKSSKILRYHTVRSVDETSSSSKNKLDNIKPRTSLHSIHMQRFSIEKIDSNSEEIPKSSSKSVLERRLEIESMTRGTLRTSQRQLAKPTQVSRPIPTRTSNFQRTSSEDIDKREKAINSIDKSNIPKPGPSSAFKERGISQDVKTETDNQEKSWVKSIVNKFQD